MQTKKVATIAILVVGIIAAIWEQTPEGKREAAQQAAQEAADAKREAQQEQSDAKKAAYEAMPADEKKYPDLQKFPALAALLNDQTNDDPPLPIVRGFLYDPTTKNADVQVNMDQNLTSSLTSNGIKMLTSDIYIAIYSQHAVPVKTVAVQVFGPLEDRYGKSSQGMVFSTELPPDVASNINWKADKTDLEFNILPKNWIVDFNLNNTAVPPAANDASN